MAYINTRAAKKASRKPAGLTVAKATADVRKVVLEEPPGHMTLDSDPARRARALLFGSWEMNWVAFNDGADVVLPGWKGDPLPFFMYPQCETADGALDSLDADAFRYRIAAREIA